MSHVCTKTVPNRCYYALNIKLPWGYFSYIFIPCNRYEASGGEKRNDTWKETTGGKLEWIRIRLNSGPANLHGVLFFFTGDNYTDVSGTS